MTFEESRAAISARIAAAATAHLGALAPSEIRDAMGHAMEGGKRLRGFLVIESARLHGVAEAAAMPAAVAVEALHAYSLVHDDLPCMDDDDLRRGRPTVHRAWDEATAVLAGDALQALAFGALADPAIGDARCRIALVASLARAAGADGMVLGQAQDMAAEIATQTLDLAAVQRMQANKTGALIVWSAEAGARMAAADRAPMTAYAVAIGLAFQIADDILDVSGEADAAGKRLRKDVAAGKATFVSLLGLAAARARAQALVEEACAALDPFGAEANSLKDLARFVIARGH